MPRINFHRCGFDSESGGNDIKKDQILFQKSEDNESKLFINKYKSFQVNLHC